MTCIDTRRSIWELMAVGEYGVCLLNLQRKHLEAAYREFAGKDALKAWKNFDIAKELDDLIAAAPAGVDVIKRVWQQAKAERNAKDFERRCKKAGLTRDADESKMPVEEEAKAEAKEEAKAEAKTPVKAEERDEEAPRKRQRVADMDRDAWWTLMLPCVASREAHRRLSFVRS
jgi:hypothetical protein